MHREHRNPANSYSTHYSRQRVEAESLARQLLSLSSADCCRWILASQSTYCQQTPGNAQQIHSCLPYEYRLCRSLFFRNFSFNDWKFSTDSNA